MQTPTSTKPMLYSQPMVVSILNDTKNQTRRIVKPQPRICEKMKGTDQYSYFDDKKHNGFLFIEDICPYGKIGDTIWVKETYYAYGYWQHSFTTKTGKQKWRFKDFTIEDKGGKYLYEDCKPNIILKNNERKFGWYKRPSLFMPKIASRITLQITGIKIERLQDISKQDAIGEGIESWIEERLKSKPTHYKVYYQDNPTDPSFYTSCPLDSLETLW